jgi:RNA 2',3'-cyclic 3'-phosphodiesterase
MSAAQKARLFVAIDAPASVREALAAWARTAASALRAPGTREAGAPLRVLDPDTLHLTLCFLGSRPVGEIDLLAEALRETLESEALELEPPELLVGAPIWLPPRRPRALAVEIHDAEPATGALARLQRVVARAVSNTIEWQPERRRFRGHVTVARARSGARAGRRSSLSDARLPPTPQRSFTPARVVLYRSWLAPTGATYEPVASSGFAVEGRARRF